MFDQAKIKRTLQSQHVRTPCVQLLNVLSAVEKFAVRSCSSKNKTHKYCMTCFLRDFDVWFENEFEDFILSYRLF